MKIISFPRSPEIKRILKATRDSGIPIGAVDIRPDGITIHPPIVTGGGSAYDAWKSKNAG